MKSLCACRLAYRTSNSDRRLRLFVFLKCEFCRKWQPARGRRAKCCVFLLFVVAVSPHLSWFRYRFFSKGFVVAVGTSRKDTKKKKKKKKKKNSSAESNLGLIHLRA
ncbi:hypothetical protein BHM03_00008512 [Ensete ventricosum]|nr:hypothetical protein BHM03_00008512 [Ensete ventricosum]